MLKHFVYTYLLISLVSFARAQEKTGISLHDLNVSLEKSKKDTSRVNTLLQLSEYYFYKPLRNENNLDSSLLYGYAALKLSNTLHYQLGVGNSYEQISKVFHLKNDTAKGKYFANKAIEIFKATISFRNLAIPIMTCLAIIQFIIPPNWLNEFISLSTFLCQRIKKAEVS